MIPSRSVSINLHLQSLENPIYRIFAIAWIAASLSGVFACSALCAPAQIERNGAQKSTLYRNIILETKKDLDYSIKERT